MADPAPPLTPDPVTAAPPSPDAAVSVRGVTKTFPGGAAPVLSGVSLDVRRGEFFSLLGPSGCGKTTLLRILAGFEEPDAGEVRLLGRDARGVPPHRRDVHTVFQSYALFPHLSVFDNVAFGLRMKRLPRAAVNERVAHVLDLVRVADLARRRPAELSGGQRQRVALARAIVNEPGVLLLDEPLSALDRKLRAALQVELKNLQASLGLTFVFVTHDQEEALVMSDRIAVMNGGRVEQVGRAEDLYERPRTAFVADFLGTSNLVEGVVRSVGPEGAVLATRHGDLLARAAGTLRTGETAVLCVRPEKLRLSRAAPAGPNAVRARVADLVYTGAENQYHLDAQGARLVAFQLNADVGQDDEFAVGEDVTLTLPPENLVVLGRP